MGCGIQLRFLYLACKYIWDIYLSMVDFKDLCKSKKTFIDEIYLFFHMKWFFVDRLAGSRLVPL